MIFPPFSLALCALVFSQISGLCIKRTEIAISLAGKTGQHPPTPRSPLLRSAVAVAFALVFSTSAAYWIHAIADEKLVGMVFPSWIWLIAAKIGRRDTMIRRISNLQVEWCSGSESMEEILARVHEREAASVKRERALTENFLMAWQFENRITRPVTSVTPKRVQSKEDSKRTSTVSSKVPIQADFHSNDGKVPSNRPDSAVVKKLFSENSPSREASETGQDVEATTKPEHST